MSWYEVLLNFFPFVNMLLALAIIFIEKKDVNATLTWLLVLFFLPIFGFFLYLFLGQNLSRRKMFQLGIDEERLLKNYMRQNKEYVRNSKTYSSDEVRIYRKLINLYVYHDIAPFIENNRVKIYTHGKDKFADLLKEINDAEKYIYMQYFIFKTDELGKEILNALAAKARSGVEVRFLYDRLGSSFVRTKFLTPLIEAGGKHAAYFPSKLKFIDIQINYRNHRKIVVIDDKIGFVGGMNVGDEYIGKTEKFGGWRDTHLKIEGDAVDSLKVRFLLDWRWATGENVEFTSNIIKRPEFAEKVPMQIVSSGPNSEWETIKFGFLSMIGDAKESIFIQSPYFIPDQGMRELLKVAVLSGVDVRIMIPNKPDHPFVYWATLHYAGELLQLGAKVYIYNKGFLHPKNIAIDNKVVSVGTTNMDIRSFRINFEVNAFIYDKETTNEFYKIFIKDMEDSKQLTLDDYNNRSLIVKIKEGISRLLSPLL